MGDSPASAATSLSMYDHAEYDAESTSSMNIDAVKLFVGQVPRTMVENDLRPILEQFGEVYDCVIIRDKINGTHRGCAFVTYCHRDAADSAIEALHNKVILPTSTNPLQVRPAEGQAGGESEMKFLFYVNYSNIHNISLIVLPFFYGYCSLSRT